MAKGKRFYWSAEKFSVALELRNKGWSFDKIGRYLNCSVQCVTDQFERMGLDTSRTKTGLKTNLSDEQLEEIEREMEAGIPVTKLAPKYNLAPSTMLRGVIYRKPNLRKLLRAPGAPKSTPLEEELRKIEHWGKYNIPIGMIAVDIKRSELFLREKLQDEGDNPWKEAYYRGRVAAQNLSGMLLEKNMVKSFSSNKEISPVMLQAVKHWDNRMNHVGTRIEASVTDERSIKDYDKSKFEKAGLLTPRHLRLIRANKITESELMKMDRISLLEDAQRLNAMSEAEFAALLSAP